MLYAIAGTIVVIEILQLFLIAVLVITNTRLINEIERLTNRRK